MPVPPRPLTALEARVLGVLVEKQATVPDTYPLTLNALVAGCNQKTARWPVIEAAEPEVQAAVDALKAMSLVLPGPSSRVVRWEHNLPRALALPGAAAALLAVLMLRGPQTAAELRAHAERLHRFADLSSVEGFLEEMAAKDPPRVVLLPRAPGAREARWAHLLCGEPALPPASLPARPAGHTGFDTRVDAAADPAADIASLREALAMLQARVDALEQALGMAPAPVHRGDPSAS
jgi:uncharacterized protein YceH (UPF0502 family)